jgi:hypothetical protein
MLCRIQVAQFPSLRTDLAQIAVLHETLMPNEQAGKIKSSLYHLRIIFTSFIIFGSVRVLKMFGKQKNENIKN